MRNLILAALACRLCCAALPALADQPSSEASAREPAATVPIERLIAGVARRTGKTFVVDPRVRADILIIARTPPEFSYEQLLGILEIYGFAAFEEAGFVRVVPDAAVKTLAMPVITSKDTRPASEYVTEIVTVKNVSAAQLVPILRPFVPQVGGMVASSETNSLILVDTFANLRRIEQIVRTLDNTSLRRPQAAAPAGGNSSDTEH
jgi:type II secretory pathway component GspD/PulD (secretin)